VLPGPTRSEGVVDFFAKLAGEQGVPAEALEKQFITAHRPTSLTRCLASVEEVANMVVYVCSPQASATTGAALRVDGAWCARSGEQTRGFERWASFALPTSGLHLFLRSGRSPKHVAAVRRRAAHGRTDLGAGGGGGALCFSGASLPSFRGDRMRGPCHAVHFRPHRRARSRA
jgi:hypothetical protein